MYWRDIHLDYVIVEWETEGKTVREIIYVQISLFQFFIRDSWKVFKSEQFFLVKR
jgi:hypothetical protein